MDVFSSIDLFVMQLWQNLSELVLEDRNIETQKKGMRDLQCIHALKILKNQKTPVCKAISVSVQLSI